MLFNKTMEMALETINDKIIEELCESVKGYTFEEIKKDIEKME